MARAAVLIIDAGRVAVIERRNRRSPNPYYVFPGGGIEAGESAVEAAAREAWEELGVRVAIGELIATVRYEGNEQAYFAARITGGRFGTGMGAEMRDPPTPEKGSYGPRWMPLGDLLDLPVYPRAVARLVAAFDVDGWPPTPQVFDDAGWR